jgi:hypothetical protein
MCSKGKARTVANVAASGFLSASVLRQLLQKEEIHPDDSLSMVGKRHNCEKQLKLPTEIDYDASVDNEQQELLLHPSKRLKSCSDQFQQTERIRYNQAEVFDMQSTTTGPTTYASYTDASVLELLKEIETSQLTHTELSFRL